jgi:hypothetical protein
MSVSQVIQNLRAKEQANVEKALAHQQMVNKLLSVLPVETPGNLEVDLFGYCAEASLTFSGDGGEGVDLTRRLYELYPPLECVDAKGSTQTQKPLQYLRDQELSDSSRPIFPVLVKHEGSKRTARWWTTLAGHVVAVQVKDGSLSSFKDILEHRYVPDSHSYGGGSVSFMTRALAEPAVRPGAMVSWMSAWRDFAEAKGLNMDAAKFVMTVAKHMGERTLAIPSISEAELAKVTLPHRNELSPFTAYFSKEEQAEVAAFAKTQYEKLDAAREQQAEDFAVVRKWFENFFGRFGFLYTNDGDMNNRIAHSLRKGTGLDVSIQMMNPHRTSVSLSVYFKGWEEYPSYYIPFSQEPNPSRVKAQDIDVEYVA